MKNFHQLGEFISNAFFRMEVHKLRLEMGIKGTGKIVFGPLIKVGGDTRLRLEWKRKALTKKTKRPSNHELTAFFEDMGDILFSSIPKYQKGLSSRVEIGLGVSAKGKLALAELGGYAVPSVFFKRTEDYNKTVKSDNLDGEILVIVHGTEKVP